MLRRSLGDRPFARWKRVTLGKSPGLLSLDGCRRLDVVAGLWCRDPPPKFDKSSQSLMQIGLGGPLGLASFPVLAVQPVRLLEIGFGYVNFCSFG